MSRYKEYRSMKVYSQSGHNYVSTPTIVLKGAWLRDLSFEEGTPIRVKCEGGRLTITRADEVRSTGMPVSMVAEPVAAYDRG